MLATQGHRLDEVLLGLALLFAVCVVVVVIFHRLRLPSIAGFLVAGALIGPHALGLVNQPELVEQLAEIGVVVLLFTIGMELSLPELLRMRRLVLLGGGLQVVLTAVLGALSAWVGGLEYRQAIFLGYLLALSSTAVVTKILQERGQLSSPVGRLAVSICVAQDLAIVPMILTLPLLAGGQAGSLSATLANVGRAFVLLLVTTGVAWFLVRRILDLVSRTRSREVFVLTVFTLCLGAAIATSYLGLSMALGAFLVGAVLGSSGYQHQAAADVEPFRDTLASLFFVSIGMLFDFRVILERPVTVLLALAAVIIGKAVLVFGVSRLLSLPRWVGLRTGLLLAQVGEFSFVLVQLGRQHHLMNDAYEKVFLVVAVLSIAVTPLLVVVSRRLTVRRGSVESGTAEPHGKFRRHVIVVGFGPIGQAVVHGLQRLKMPFVVVEMNAATVKQQREAGLSIFLGDSTREAVLHAAGIHDARSLVLGIPDGGAVRRTAELARRLNPGVHIVARSMFLADVPSFLDAGVDNVVPQELETSIEVMVHVLRHCLVPDDEIGRSVREVRTRSFGIFKAARPERADSTRVAEFLPGLTLQILYVGVNSVVGGKTLAEAQIRKITGFNVVGISRGSQTLTTFGPEMRIEEGDVVVLIGPEKRSAEVAVLFHAPDAPMAPIADDVSG